MNTNIERGKKDDITETEIVNKINNGNTLTIDEQIERVAVVAAKLKEKYKSYEDTCLFVDYLKATDEIFIRAINEKWSAEKTKKEMIEGEIYLMSLQTGIDEKVFKSIYDEFKKMSANAERVQMVAKKLIDKYKDRYNDTVKEFIYYIRDYLLIFSKDWDLNKNSLDSIKNQIIQARMRVLSASCNNPSLNILENIYKEFLLLIKDTSIDLNKI